MLPKGLKNSLNKIREIRQLVHITELMIDGFTNKSCINEMSCEDCKCHKECMLIQDLKHIIEL